MQLVLSQPLCSHANEQTKWTGAASRTELQNVHTCGIRHYESFQVVVLPDSSFFGVIERRRGAGFEAVTVSSKL
jgi:hypothetical protein